MPQPRLPVRGLWKFLLPIMLSAGPIVGQVPAARELFPNLESNIERPLRYKPEGSDFVIRNGKETFNRPLYGGNTAFRVDGGDRPEFVLYLPGRGGNLRLALGSATGAKWLQNAAQITMRYRPGELLYEVRDPILGASGVLHVTALAYNQTEGLVVRAKATDVSPGVQLVWAFGGVNGQRGVRDGDIGTERIPISEYFQLQPDFCKENTIEMTGSTFTLRAKPAILFGVAPAGAKIVIGDANYWNDLPALLAPAVRTPALPVVISSAPLTNGQPLLFSVQRIAINAPAAEELSTYREVSADRAGVSRSSGLLQLAPAFAAVDLPLLFDETEKHFNALRNRVAVETPDPFLNAAVGALNVAADAVWDDPQQGIMHGAIAWRTRLLGWRGPYLLDALGWPERARAHFLYWAGRQNTDSIPEKLPPPDENSNLARNEAALHSNGDLSNSHYDMNTVYIDALFRHLRWTGDVDLAKKVWPVIERHLAWERRLFRREFGPNKLPLYEAYAVIWASDDLQYSGGGAAHSSAYNYFHNKLAAQLAPLVGADPSPYAREADLIAQAMRTFLWVQKNGMFAESKDWLGLQLVHPSAALWTFYHTLDSELPTPTEAWQMTRYVDARIPHLPVRGQDVPAGLHTLGTSSWMPYDWSINNVVMAEAVHGALGFWQAGRPDEAWRITKGSLLAAMFMGISPGNVGSMSCFDVYRRESQRDFADGSGVFSRALIEGLFGIKPNVLDGQVIVAPGFPVEWEHASLHHPNIDFAYHRDGQEEIFHLEPRFVRPINLSLELPMRGESAHITVDGREVSSQLVRLDSVVPKLKISGLPAGRIDVKVVWSGKEPRVPAEALASEVAPSKPLVEDLLASEQNFNPVDLTAHFNARVTQIFHMEYRSPRSPFASLALPKQGLGGWAGGMNAKAEIDDTGLRAAAARNGGRIVLPDGVPFETTGLGEGNNIVFTSQWDNFPREAVFPLSGRARRIYLLMAGSTNPMQSRIDNGEVVISYTDGTDSRLALRNPETWWPIEQDYFIDDFQFRFVGPLPIRVDLKTGNVRVLQAETFKGRGRTIPGGAASVFSLSLDSGKELKSLTVRALANDVVVGLMSATLQRP